MSQVLYRKYRPQKFSEVIGQDHVIDPIRESIKNGKIAHAYLFYGGRGTGKTSVARIIADSLKTEQHDIYEIDAASNRGIDDIRELREGVHTLPYSSEYKIYIIDEVHMLTKEAFNALLKTLEEPPNHVIFILATTELEKLPETIVSRCQLYTFKKPNQSVLKKMVLKIAKEEGYDLDSATSELMAVLGDGSFRDTLGILQKVIGSSSDKKITIGEVEKVTGAPKREVIHSFVSSLASGDKNNALEVLSTVASQGMDIKTFTKLVIVLVRYILIIRSAKNMSDLIKEEVGEDEYKYIEDILYVENSKINSKVLKHLIEAHNQINFSSITSLPLELAIIDLE